MLGIQPLEVIDVSSMTWTQALAIGELMSRVWPKPGVGPQDRAERLLESHSTYRSEDERQAPRSFAVFELGQVVAHAWIGPRDISTRDGRITIAALARVCTDPLYRGRGLGELVVRGAFAEVDEGVYPSSLFQTTPKAQGFYERLGAVVATNKIVNSLGEAPEANPFWDPVVMRYPAQGPWSGGTIDLLGYGY
jgi:GNAT superfamily N-acetyltransferase